MIRLNREVTIGVVLTLTPLFFFALLIVTITTLPRFWEYSMWLFGPMLFIGLPIGLGKLFSQWAIAKNNLELAKFIRIIFYLISALLSVTILVPEISRLGREQIAKFNQPSQEKIEETLNDYYSKRLPLDKIESVQLMGQSNGNWIVTADVCMKGLEVANCVPMNTVINSDGKVDGSAVDVDRLRDKLNKIIGKDAAK